MALGTWFIDPVHSSIARYKHTNLVVGICIHSLYVLYVVCMCVCCVSLPCEVVGVI